MQKFIVTVKTKAGGVGVQMDVPGKDEPEALLTVVRQLWGPAAHFTIIDLNPSWYAERKYRILDKDGADIVQIVATVRTPPT